MKKRYHLENLNCPDCAAKIEKTLAKASGVRKVKLNFSIGVLDVESDDDVDVKKIVRSVESGIRIVEEGEKKYSRLFPSVLASVIFVISFF